MKTEEQGNKIAYLQGKCAGFSRLSQIMNECCGINYEDIKEYPAFFYKDESGYSVVFYDIELATMGETLEEATVMAEKALTGRISLLLKDGESPPNPTAIEDIEKPENAEFITLIKTDRKYLTQEKVSVKI